MPFVPDNPASAAGRFVPDKPSGGVDAALTTTKDLATVYGPLEAGANLLTGLVGGFPAFLGGGTGTMIREGGLTPKAAEVGEQFAQAATYQPQSEAGKRLSALVNLPFHKLLEWAKAAGEKTADVTGSAPAAATIEALVQMAPVALGFVPRGTKGKAAGKPAEEPVAAPAASGKAFPVEPLPEPKAARAVPPPPEEIPPPKESPFPIEAGDLDSVLPRFVPDEPARAAEAPALELTGQTEAEIRATEAAQSRERAAEAAVEAAPAPEDFTLTGSTSAVDEARARGQMELAPAEAPSEAVAALTPRERALKQAAIRRDRVDPEKDTLSTIMGKFGGISADELLKDGMDKATLKDLKTAVVGRPAWRRNGGLSLDAMGEKLGELGFDVYDEAGRVDAYKVRELIEQEASGERVYTAEGYEYQARLAEEAKALEAEPEMRAKAEDDSRALAEFGPGALGSNRFLDPALIGKTAGDVAVELLGQPGEHRNLFNPIRDREQHSVARIERWAAGEGEAIRKAFPGEAEENLTLRLAKGDLEGLTPAQRSVAEKLRQNFRQLWEYAENAGRSLGYQKNYSPQVWDTGDSFTKGKLDAWRAERGDPPAGDKAAGDSAGVLSPFMMKKSIDLFEGMAMGMKPKTLKASALFETYARSMATAVERGKTLTGLKELVSDDGTAMVIPREQAPRDYVKIDNPELEGLRVHPDIAPTVRVLVESNDPGVIATAVQTLAYTTKRALVSYSFFHPKALLEAFVGAGGNPATVKGAIDAALKRYREGGPGDVIDKGLAAGLKIGAPLEDVLGRDKFKDIISRTAGALDKAGAPIKLPAGAPLRGLKAADEALQRLTWNYIHTGLKLDIYSRAYERGRMKHPEVADGEGARQAAEFTNALFGGLNWERMIDSFDTPSARKVMSEVLSKQGRSVMQSTLFAPDWLVSTFGTWTNALGTSQRNAFKRELARRYLATSAVVTFGIGSALNYYFTGHSMFENKSNKKNATTADHLKAKMEVQLGDGRRMNLAKHFFEVPHAAVDPLQFAYNKLNPVVSEPIEQLANKQWLSSTWAPPITKKSDTLGSAAVKRGKHALEKFLPITGHQLLEQGPAGLGGFFGFPIYGLTEEQKRQKRAEGK